MAGGSRGTQIWEITNEKQNEYQKRTASEWRKHAVTRVNMISAALRMLVLLLCLCMHKTLFIGLLAATRVSLWRCEIMWMNLMCSAQTGQWTAAHRVVARWQPATHWYQMHLSSTCTHATQNPYQMSTWNDGTFSTFIQIYLFDHIHQSRFVLEEIRIFWIRMGM